MSAYGLLVFSLIYALAVATPGPGVAAILARALGRGVAGAPAFIGGFIAGDLLWFTLAALGLAVLAQQAHALFVGVRFAGAAYLLYLAWRLWRAPSATLSALAPPERESTLQLFLGALALTLGNPKTMVFFLAVLPTVVDLAHLTGRWLPDDRRRHRGGAATGARQLYGVCRARPRPALAPADRALAAARDRRGDGGRRGRGGHALGRGAAPRAAVDGGRRRPPTSAARCFLRP